MRNALEALWSRPWACLVVSPLALLAGGALLLGAVQEIYGDYGAACRVAGATCHDPRGWVVIALSAGGFACFALGAIAWLRAFRLVLRARGAQAVR
jgi:hypothetical protein